MAKRAGRYHAQLLIERSERARLHAFLDTWLAQVDELKSGRALRWSLDVDPLELY
jgi:primosomal protein N' (replication factor Y)